MMMMKMLIYMIFLFLMSLFFMNLSLKVYLNNYLFILEWVIIYISTVNFNMFIYLDYISFMFMSLVLFISSMIMMYSINYMESEKNISRFNWLLMLFISSMMLMIMSPSILSILLGWDGLGLISYCLVIYYQNKTSFNSGMITIMCNRIGDISLLMLICFCMINGSFYGMIYNMTMLMMFLLLMCCFTKSSQIPFSPWLPAAMTAPTPISSLVHSSTLVTAGVYLMIRYYDLFNINFFNKYILFISSLTMFMSGLIANFEYDFKKVIALSTLSQLGLMFSILSLGYIELSFFHLFIHALFKSLMFMCTGSYIHLMNNNQDIRKYGGLLMLMPFYSLIFMISNLCLCGFPFLAGFYSKDLIMEILWMSNLSLMSFFFLLMATIFTISYSFRIFLYLMINECKFILVNFKNEKYLKNSMFFLLMLLVFLGNMMFNLYFYMNIIILSMFMKLLVLNLMMIGLILGYNLYKLKLNINILYFFSSMFYMNFLYKIFYMKSMKKILYYENIIEKGWLENFQSLYIMNFMMYFMKFINKNKLNWTLTSLLLLNITLMFIMMLLFL